jgi:hypothetical protein
MPKFERFGTGFKGFCANPLYQMVPVHGMRRLQFFNDGPDCEIYVTDPAVAGLTNFLDVLGRQLPTGGAPMVDSFIVPKQSTISFTVNGKTPGVTFLGFRSGSRPVDSSKGILVSVKGLLEKKVSLIALADGGGHSGKKTLTDINTIFGRVRKYYFDQCNVDLKASQPKSVTVSRALSTPVVWDKAKGGVGDIIDILLAVHADGLANDIVILFMWDVASSNDVGVDTLAVCLPNMFKGGSKTILFDDSQDAYVLAHEVGHALRLEHNLRTGSLMHRFVSSVSSELEQFEIDMVNGDGVL